MEKREVEKERLALHENINVLKETPLMKEETCSINLNELEKESLDLKGKVKSLLGENRKLLKKLKQALLQTGAGTGPHRR